MKTILAHVGNFEKNEVPVLLTVIPQGSRSVLSPASLLQAVHTSWTGSVVYGR